MLIYKTDKKDGKSQYRVRINYLTPSAETAQQKQKRLKRN